ncbi:MAG: HPr family phosphocarrier protein [Oscillospiraceae bacterium]|nr:HPr family phosphocarrier protein [Ruminococcus sp.]MDD6097105.1 HPr family phosphocarrier protein [Oscillospiraceae bacterium]
MKKFTYIIKDETGIHARPAGLLVKAAEKFSSSVKLECGGKSADGKKLFSVMSLGAKCGAEVIVTVEGTDEDEAAAALESFFGQNL